MTKVANDIHTFDDKQPKKLEGDSKSTYYSLSKLSSDKYLERHLYRISHYSPSISMNSLLYWFNSILPNDLKYN